MKVLLLKDVYNLGRAGDVKKVADGYGRNFLLPQKLAVLATSGSLKQADHIKKVAAEQRAVLNQELGSVAVQLEGVELAFPVKAGETGRLYGSVTTSMIAEAITDQTGADIDRRQVESQPIKLLGVHSARVRLTMDLLPEIKVIVHREGEPPESVFEEEIIPEEVPTEDFAELQAELDAIDAEAEAEEAAAKAKVDAEAETDEVEAESEVEDETSDTEVEVVEADADLDVIDAEAGSDVEDATSDTEVEVVEAEAEDVKAEAESDVEDETSDTEAEVVEAEVELDAIDAEAGSDVEAEDADVEGDVDDSESAPSTEEDIAETEEGESEESE
jgi:large subunit ribosomal protein L9